MSFNNINKLKAELKTIRLIKDTSNNYTLFEYSDRNPDKFEFELVVQNAISDLYSLTNEKKLNVLKDFWDFEGEFFAYYEIARRIEIYAHSKPMDITNILLLYKDFLTPRIDINSKNFDTYFLAELKETFLERRGKICRFITLIKNKFFENKYIDFLATPKENMQIGHFIKEIEKKNPLRNQFYIKQVKTDNPKEKAKKPFLKESSKLTLRKIALINFYINKPITEDNKDEIAKQYDWKSGHKLYQHYSFYSSRANRLALPDPFTKKKYNNIIELFEKVIEHLPDNYKQKAIDEKKTIESKYNSENY